MKMEGHGEGIKKLEEKRLFLTYIVTHVCVSMEQKARRLGIGVILPRMTPEGNFFSVQ